MDQQAKQTLHYSGGIALGNFDGKILVASSSAIYSVLPIPVETQIQVKFSKLKEVIQADLPISVLMNDDFEQIRLTFVREVISTYLNCGFRVAGAVGEG